MIVYRILIDWSNKTKLYRYITPLQNVSTIIISHISRRIKRKKKKKSIAIIYQFRGLKTYKAVVAV